jgi:hypothetical protein
MKPTPSKRKNISTLLAITALCLTTTAPLTYAEEDSSNGISNFLSDPQRVGSLTGTILGGALTAHPIGTLAGSIIGFFIGKQTTHQLPSQQPLAQSSYARRSFAPLKAEETAIPALALNTTPPAIAETPLPAAPTATLLASAPSVNTSTPAIQTQTATPVIVATLAHTTGLENDISSLQMQTITTADPVPQKLSPLEQIASLCYGNGGQNKASNPDLQSLCFYHQSS